MIDLGNGVLLVTRAEWGARAPRSRTSAVFTFGITSHWEGPHMGSFPHSSCASKVRGIQNFHMDTQGWTDIAYSAIACPHRYVFECRGPNIRTAANGTTQGNDTAGAVCYLGGEGDPFTDDGKAAQRAACDWLDRNGAASGRNCHRDWKSTQCPGDTICSWVRAGLPVTDDDDDEEDDDMSRPVLCRDNANKLWLLSGDGQTRRSISDADVEHVRHFYNPQQDSDGRAFTDLPDGFIHSHVDVGVIAVSSLVLADVEQDVDDIEAAVTDE